MGGNCKEQPRIAIDGTEHTIRTTNNKILQRKLISAAIKLKKSPRKDMSLNKHHLRGPGGKNVSASEEARKLGEGIIPESQPKVWKVEPDEEDCDFECDDKSDGKPVHVEVDKEITGATKGSRHLHYQIK